MFSTLSAIVSSLSSYTPPGLILSVLSAFIVERKYFSAFRHEFIGTLLMIACTFSAGKWIGADSLPIAWIAHAIGVVSADYIGGGPHVNPAVSVSMWSLGKCNYTEMYVRIAAQMGGGLVAFPLFRYLSDNLGWIALGGPEFNPLDDDDGASGASSEFAATVLLCFLIYLLNWELNFGKFHYWIKQTLTAVGIRGLIEAFPTAGPAMNPMLGTTWAVFASGFTDGESTSAGAFPDNAEHYYVYWVAPILGALVASFGYAVYSGDTFFGKQLPLGPVKDVQVVVPSAPPAETKSKKKK